LRKITVTGLTPGGERKQDGTNQQGSDSFVHEDFFGGLIYGTTSLGRRFNQPEMAPAIYWSTEMKDGWLSFNNNTGIENQATVDYFYQVIQYAWKQGESL
jgi:hypothetical protein